MAKIVMYNVNRYHLIKALYTDIAQQVLSQLDWLSRIELWVLKALGKTMPANYQSRANQLFGTSNGSFDVYKESLKGIKSYLWGREIDGVHDLYSKLQSVQDTLGRALSFQRDYKVLTEPHSLMLDSRQLSVFENEKKLLFNVEASYYEARKVLWELLEPCLVQAGQQSNGEQESNGQQEPNGEQESNGQLEQYGNLYDIWKNITESSENRSALRRIARGVFYDENRWYVLCGGLPLLLLFLSILLISPLDFAIVPMTLLIMLFVVCSRAARWILKSTLS